MLIHLDTDLGGDTDDACALAMLLGWPGGGGGRGHHRQRPGWGAGRVCRVLPGAGRSGSGGHRAWTNLAPLEVVRPGSLARVPVVATGGWTPAPADGRPTRVLVDLDGEAFAEAFLDAVEAARRGLASSA
jgi:hypothetical protein